MKQVKWSSLIILLILVIIMVSCKENSLDNNSDLNNQSEQLYNIYLAGRESDLIDGTYEEWLLSIKGEDGIGIKSISIDLNGDVIVVYSNDEVDIVGNVKGEPGKDGETPYIGENGNWWISNVDTGINVQGVNVDIEEIEFPGDDFPNQGENNSQNHNSPYIGENGNWWIGEVDTGVFAENNDLIPPTGEFQYAVNSDGKSYVFLKYIGKDRYLKIPEYYNGYPVTVIANEAFLDNRWLEKIDLPSHLKVIEEDAFKGASNLKSIEIPKSVEKIGLGAFNGTSSLSSITLPFLGETKERIGGRGEFAYIFGIEEYENSYLAGIFYIPKNLEEVIITNSSTIRNAFNLMSSLKTIKVLEGTTTIEQYAFAYLVNLETVILPNTITTIEDYAFSASRNLTNLTIPSSVTTLGEYIVENSGIETITFKEGSQLTNIGETVFRGAIDLKNIKIPNSVESIGFGAFNGAMKLESITLPFVGESREATGNSSNFGHIFGDNDYLDSYLARKYYLPLSLREVIITDTTNIDDYAFSGSYMIKNIELPNNLISIGDHAFDGLSALENIIMPENVKSIGQYAFAYLSKLESIIIPKGVSEIGYRAFSDSNKLTIFVVASSALPDWNSNFNYSNRPIFWGAEWFYDNEGKPTPKK